MKTEKILIAIFFIGIIFKFFHLYYGSVIVIMSLTTIAALYFPLGFYFFSDKLHKVQNIALSIIAGFFLSIIPVGIVFKIQYWPGAQVILLIGSISALIILVISFMLKSKCAENLKMYYKNLILRTSFFAFFAILLYLVSSETLIKIQYREDPKLAQLKALYYLHPENKENKKLHDAYILKLDSINEKIKR